MAEVKGAVTQVLVGLLGSKKFVALCVGLLVIAAVYPLVRWCGMSEAEAKEFAEPAMTKIMALVSAYMLAQGGADFGKGKALAEGDLVGKAVDRAGKIGQ